MSLNFWRQLDVFNPSDFKKEVHVVGCGAIGSHLVDTLIRSGISNIKVYDFDDVEDHNLPNQIFNLSHVGKKKVEAMKEIAAGLGVEIEISDKKTTCLETSGQCYVFLAVDSMASRKEIWENSIKYNPSVRFLESRMAAEYGIIHCINPIDPDEVKYWEDQWFSDDEAEESACTNRAVCTTAKTMAAAQAHMLLTWETADKPAASTMVCLRPLSFITKAAR